MVVFMMVISFLVTIIINSLGAFGIINGLSQKAVSDMFPTAITPSPFTFSIWSVIYLCLFCFLVMNIVKNYKGKDMEYVSKFYNFFILSCLFNSLWIISFSFVQIELAMIFIVLLFISLYKICLSIKNERLFPKFTFGLYCGWVLIASFINLFAMLTKYGVYTISLNSVAGYIAIFIALILGVIFAKFSKNISIIVAILWAMIGILV